MSGRNATTFLIYGLPIALAALPLPALFLLLPSLSATATDTVRGCSAD